MESERENKRKRGSGRCRDENKTRKDSGKSFVTYKGVQKPAKVPPQNEVRFHTACSQMNVITFILLVVGNM